MGVAEALCAVIRQSQSQGSGKRWKRGKGWKRRKRGRRGEEDRKEGGKVRGGAGRAARHEGAAAPDVGVADSAARVYR
jgi:hypothetical protein